MTKTEFVSLFVKDLDTHYSIINSCAKTDNQSGFEKMMGHTKNLVSAAWDVGYSAGFTERAILDKAVRKASLPKRDEKGRFIPKWESNSTNEF